MKQLSRLGIPILLLLLALAARAAPVNSQTSASGNTYISGADVRVTAPVAADLFAAGRRVGVDGEVAADAAVAGGSVKVRAPVRQDLRVAGGRVEVDTAVGGDLLAAGGTVSVNRPAAIAGSAWLAGEDVTLAGTVGRGARIYANAITLSGQINGDAYLYGRDINLLPGARINGNLSYASPNPLAPAQLAQVSGTVSREQVPQGENGQRDAGPLSWLHPLFALSMLLAGVLLYLLFPRAVAGTQTTIRQQPVRSLLAGAALLFAVPPLAILLMVTVIGIPLGFMLLALYPLMLLLAYLATAFFIGRQAANAMKQPQQLKLGRQALFLALALVLLSVVAGIPFLGGLVLLAALVVGIGAWAVWGYSQYSANKTKPA